MPRHRPQVQATNTHVTTPTIKTSKPKVSEEVVDEIIVVDVQSEIEELETVSLVNEEVVVEVAVERPAIANKAIKTDVGMVATKEEPKPYTADIAPHVSAPSGLILSENEELRIEGEDMGNYVVVKRDVYREVYPPNTKRPSYFLLYNKGTEVLKSTLQPLN
jgi:hypothetical protein